MAEISRRNFLTKSSAGAAVLGAMAVLPSIDRKVAMLDPVERRHEARRSAAATSVPDSERSASQQLVAYIPDPKSGEIHYMVGTREVVHTDKALVARMLRDVS